MCALALAGSMCVTVGFSLTNTKTASAIEYNNIESDLALPGNVDGKPVFRMYNFLTGEHLWTENYTETQNLRTLTRAGKSHWESEGVGWYAPHTSKTPVYRLYNYDLGKIGAMSHYYTSNKNEIKKLCTKKWGWKNEGIAFYSGGNLAVYTAYREKGGSQHLFTVDKTEWQNLNNNNWNWDLEGTKNGGKLVSKNVKPTLKTAYEKDLYKNVYGSPRINVYKGPYRGFFQAVANGSKEVIPDCKHDYKGVKVNTQKAKWKLIKDWEDYPVEKQNFGFVSIDPWNYGKVYTINTCPEGVCYATFTDGDKKAIETGNFSCELELEPIYERFALYERTNPDTVTMKCKKCGLATNKKLSDVTATQYKQWFGKNKPAVHNKKKVAYYVVADNSRPATIGGKSKFDVRTTWL